MSVSRQSTHRRAVWMAAIVTVLWSSSWVLIRFGLDNESLEPVTFAGIRYALAAAVLAASVASTPHLRRQAAGLRPSEIRDLAVLGAVLYGLTQGAQFVAIANQPAATSSLVLSLTPLFVALLAARSVAEPPAPRQVAGAALVGLGAWLYSAGDLGATAQGMIAAGVALGSNTAAALLGRSVNRMHRASPTVVTAASMSVGSALLLLTGVATEGWPQLSLRAAVLVAWLAGVNTALAFTLWNASLRHLTAVESAGLNSTMLVQIALLAWVFLGEAPGLGGLAGIVVVSVGVLLTRSRE